VPIEGVLGLEGHWTLVTFLRAFVRVCQHVVLEAVRAHRHATHSAQRVALPNVRVRVTMAILARVNLQYNTVLYNQYNTKAMRRRGCCCFSTIYIDILCTTATLTTNTVISNL
jgi:hypothetical protein